MSPRKNEADSASAGSDARGLEQRDGVGILSELVARDSLEQVDRAVVAAAACGGERAQRALGVSVLERVGPGLERVGRRAHRPSRARAAPRPSRARGPAPPGRPRVRRPALPRARSASPTGRRSPPRRVVGLPGGKGRGARVRRREQEQERGGHRRPPVEAPGRAGPRARSPRPGGVGSGSGPRAPPPPRHGRSASAGRVPGQLGGAGEEPVDGRSELRRLERVADRRAERLQLRREPRTGAGGGGLEPPVGAEDGAAAA